MNPPSSAATTEPSALAPGDVRFCDRASAGRAGRYEFTVRQTLVHPDINGGQDQFDGVPAFYDITAARFALDPAAVHSVHPAPAGSGRYRNVLPHLVLTHAPLPWERSLRPTAPTVHASTGSTTDPVWVALLLLSERELPEGRIRQGSVEDLLVKPTVVDLPHFGDTLTDEEKRGPCRTIDLDPAVFAAVLPREAELRYLAHVQRVRTNAGERNLAVVLANRLPRPAGPYVAHLVSLEGHADRLPGTAPTPNSGSNPVRLVSLWSWSFTCQETAGGFAAVADHLAATAAPLRVDPDHVRPPHRHDPAGAGQPGGTVHGSDHERATVTDEDKGHVHVTDRLDTGYVPVAYQTVSGERTTAWYRGPFTPRPARRPLPAEPAAECLLSADHALIYLEEQGMFDISYAVAWTVGRLLALANPTLASRVMGTRATAHDLVRRLLALSDRTPVPARALRGLGTAAIRLTGPLDGDDRERLRAALRPGALRATLTDEVTTGALDQAWRAPLRHPATDNAHPATAPSSAASGHATRATADVREESRSTWDEAPEHVRAMHRLFDDPAMREVVCDILTERLDPGDLDLRDVLALVTAVPFHHLVARPDQLLPPESLRLFHIDPDWLRALTDGVLSVGAHTRLDAALSPILREVLVGDPPPRRCGLLLRSVLVRHWPDVIITAEPATVTILRRDHIAPDTTLLLFNQAPTSLSLREPRHATCFGLRTDTAGDHLGLRRITGSGGDIGSDLPDNRFPATAAFSYFRDTGRDGPVVLNLLSGTNGSGQDLITALCSRLTTRAASPAALALQLLVLPHHTHLKRPGEWS